MTDVDPLQLLTSDLQSNDYETIIQSVNQIITVAIALGPDRTRTQLLPLLGEFAGISNNQSLSSNNQTLDVENDEAQTAVARQLALFTPLIGGPQYLHLLLPLMEKYCGEEEFVVRNTAVQSLNTLIPQFPQADLVAKFIPILKRLSNGDWFTTRVSACGLFSVTYQSINQSNDQALNQPANPSVNQSVKESILSELRSLFYNLCNDDTPMVRKAAFTALPDYAQALRSSPQSAPTPTSNQYFKSDVLPIVKAISIDDMDVMRVHAVDVVASLISQSIVRSSNQTNNPSIEDATDLLTCLMPLIDGLIDDQSWRVRAALAKHFSKVCSSARLIDQPIDQANPQPINTTTNLANNQARKMWTLFLRLMKDREGEVRAAACEQLDCVLSMLVSDNQSNSPSVNQTLAREFIETASSVFESLTTDVQQSVRINLSKALINVCALFKSPNTQLINQTNQPNQSNQPVNPASDLVLNHLIPRLHTFSRDESYEVRHASLLHFSTLLPVVGIATVSSIVVPVLIESSKDVKWRVRYACLHACATLAYHLGAAAFDKRLLPGLIAALSDHVYGVRQLACRQLGLVAAIEHVASGQADDAFGPKWAAERLFPAAFVLFDKTTNYRHRMTVLLLIEQVAACYGRTNNQTINQMTDQRDIDDEIAHTHETSLIHPSHHQTNNQTNNQTNDVEFNQMIDQHCSPILAQACIDGVANVRVAAAKTLTVLEETDKIDRRAVFTRFNQLLTKMTSDSDSDVAFFAQVAIRALAA